MKTKITQVLILCILFTMVLPLNVWAADSMTFEMDENYVNGNIYSSVRGVMANQGNYIAWGQYGNIQTSTDGINWTSGHNSWANDSVAGNLYSIVYNDAEKKYVGIGKNCYASSLDGKTWQSEASSQNVNNNDLLYANGNYYGVGSGYGGRIQKSTDGKSWRTLTTGLPNSNSSSTNYYNLSGITYGNGKYIVVGSQGKVLSSSDGENWSTQTLEQGNNYINLIDVIYAGGQYVIVGSEGAIYTSNDGNFWVKRNSNLERYDYNTLSAIGYGDGKYVALGSSKDLTSTDGINWSGTSTDSYGYSKKVCYDTSGFVASSGVIAHSSDGTSWTNVDKPSSQTISYISDLQFLNGQYVAVGNGFMSSPDGVVWTRKNDNEVLNRISYGNGKYVGIGTSKTYSTIVKTSIDGVTWQPQTVNVTDSLWKADITYGSGKFVLVGNKGLILYSTDGTNWTKSVSGVTDCLRSVLFANGHFIAAGDNGTILYSSDGVTWTPASSGLSSTDFNSVLQNLEYGNGQIVVVGSNYEKGSISYGGYYFSAILSSVILSSSDGITWTKRTSPSTCGLEGVSYGNGRFVAIGNAGTVLSCTDGATWTTESPFTTGTLGMIASNGSGFLIGRTLVDSDLLFRSTSTGSSTTPSGDWQTGFINEPVNKSWTIHFKQEVDRSTVNSSTVYVTTTNGTKLKQDFSYSADGKSLILTPQASYSSGGEYYLYVTTGVKSSTGIPLKSNVTMHFTVR